MSRYRKLESKTIGCCKNQLSVNSSSLVIFVLQISPFILNTVMTITAAMAAKKKEELSTESQTETCDLWSVMNIYECNYWFLGVDQAMEVTESFSEPDGRNEGESFAAEIKV